MRSFGLACVFLIGCYRPTYSLATAPMPVPSDTELEQLLSHASYKGPGYTRVNRAAYPSTLAAGSFINVYVTAKEAAAYAEIDPDVHGSGVELPSGTVIVREVEDSTGHITKLTLMVRHPSGWFADGGDWMFAAADPIGTPLDDDHGAAEWGPLQTCGSCHAPRADDGWVFGVKRSAR